MQGRGVRRFPHGFALEEGLGVLPVLGAAALTLLLFLVYALGACPTIYVGDSGELVTAVHVLGIPHPPGSPLYVLAGKLWTILVPGGSVAWQMSLFSALWAAGACGLLFLLCRAMPVHPVAALFAALLLAFSPSFWGEANVQRVYSLSAFFVVLATGAAWRWHRRRDVGSLAMAFFCCGLGATGHIFMVVYAVALAVFVVVSEPAILRRWRHAVAAGGSLGVGLLPYLYLPLRSRADPPLDWGNPETVAGLLDAVLRRDYWGRVWLETSSDLLTIAGDYLWSLGGELGWAGAALAVIGLVAGWRRGWPVLLPVLVMAGNLTSLALHGSRVDLFVWHRYYIPSYLMGALLAGIGCHVLLQRLPRALWAVPLAIPVFLAATGWTQFDRSRYRIAEEFSTAVLRSLPPNAHLMATGDSILFVLMYLRLAEQRRPDVDLIFLGAGVSRPPALRFDPRIEPLFLTHAGTGQFPGLDVIPVGIVFRAWPRGEPPPPPAEVAPELAGEHDPRVPKDFLTQNLIGYYHYLLGLTAERTDWPRAAKEFETAAAAAPSNDALFYNLGLAYVRNGLLEEAITAFERSHAINPRRLADSRLRAADRLVELRAVQGRLRRLEEELARDPSVAATRPGTPARHERLADMLDAKGETLAAKGHRVRARLARTPEAS